tara:strand:+ start:599 stop:1207 length:609 start_codon:yes stop_codon:yes gene_type:complete
MIICCHRINSIKELKKIPYNYGIEIDVRDFNKKIILNHDPFLDGENFDNFCKYFKHNFIIINVKSEGIEKKIYLTLLKFKIKNFFFLDSSYPFIFKLSKSLTKNFAIRVSDYESINTAINFKKKAKWIWLDCFKNYRISTESLQKLKKCEYKICLVSPHLHGRKYSTKDIKFIKKNLRFFDIICEKHKKVNLLSKLTNYTFV